MDISSILGLIIALVGLIGGIYLEGGHLGAYVAISAAFIVFGGTAGAVILSFPMKDIAQVPKLFKIAFVEAKYDLSGVITILVSFAEKARREGLLSLEAELAAVEDVFLKQGIQLVVDGTDPSLVRSILETQIAFLEERHKVGAKIFEAAGGYAPTMGIIGTVLGLVEVLGNMEDPEALAGKIALAFLATLYGVGSANVFWLPLANKLKMKNSEEALAKEVMLEGILSIQAGDNPRIVEEKLRAFLPPSLRKQSVERE